MWWSSQFLTDSSNQWENCEKDEDDFGKLNKKNEKIWFMKEVWTVEEVRGE